MADLVTVLIVDDDPFSAEPAAYFLRQAGFEVLIEGSYSSAKDALDEKRPSFLISDISLADGSGADLLTHARSLGIPGAALTGYSVGEVEGELPPHTPILTKPVDFDSLPPFVTHHLEKGSSEKGSPRVANF